MDDLPGLFGSEVESGNWQTGLSEDGTMQFIWSDQPDVFTIRCGSKIDPDDWSIRDEDVQLRFWREESLRDVAEAAGLSAPMVQADGAILVMRSARAAGSH